MRDTFGEWYWPDDDDLREIVSTGLIVLDANVLLDLYRHSAKTRESLFSTLEDARIRPRLRLPYQAGLEFHRNRLKVAGEHKRQYDDVLVALDKLEESPEAVLGGLFDPIRAVRDRDVQGELEQVARKASKQLVRRVRRELQAAAEANVLGPTDVRVRDEVRDRIEGLFKDPGQVGARPSDSDREKRDKDARDRLGKKLPPGTEDSKKDDGGVGDALIWLEMKDLAAAEKLPVLFVSGDLKRDWMYRSGGAAAGPLPALRQEFADDTGQVFHSMTWLGLLENVRTYLDVEVAAEAVQLVEADEREANRRWLLATARAAGSTPTEVAKLAEATRADGDLEPYLRSVSLGNAFADLAKQAGVVDATRISSAYESIMKNLRENTTYPRPSEMFADAFRQNPHVQGPAEMALEAFRQNSHVRPPSDILADALRAEIDAAVRMSSLRDVDPKQSAPLAETAGANDDDEADGPDEGENSRL